jgi:hypothetical protein
VPPLISALTVAALLATVVAVVAALAPGDAMQTWVRRLFLVLINLSPWTLGTWRSSLSRRETFLAACFLTFVVALVVLAVVPFRWQR